MMVPITFRTCINLSLPIAEKAHCDRATVSKAIKALEDAGVLTWVNRIARIREWGPDLFGRALNRWRVIRTSNPYTFRDPQPGARPPDSSKSKITTGTPNQDLNLLLPDDPALRKAVQRLGSEVKDERCRA